jgi:glycosyltransferase involved in cell wall biosynthesis
MANQPLPASPSDSTAGGAESLAVSVIMPHYNDLANLERCIAMLAAQTLPRSQFEIVVADNNSRCGLDEVRRVCGDAARVIAAPIQGAGAARNAAVAASSGKILAFIDSDCRPSPTWLESGLAAVSAERPVGGQVEVDCEDPANPTAVEAFERVFAFNVKRYIEQEGFAVTANMFVPRDIFERVGDFRPNVGEDRDWGRRAVAAGYRWRFAPDVVVSHPARRDWAELTKKWRRITREAYAEALEGPNAQAKWVASSFLILASPFAHWAAAATTEKLDTGGERLKAIGVLFAIRFWRFGDCIRVMLASDPGGGATAKKG